MGGQWKNEDNIKHFIYAAGVDATAFGTAKNNWNADAPAIHFTSAAEDSER
jgi:hypothetical protein